MGSDETVLDRFVKGQHHSKSDIQRDLSGEKSQQFQNKEIMRIKVQGGRVDGVFKEKQGDQHGWSTQ